MSIAVVFPGQGSQTVGMGKDFYEKFPASKEFFEKADNALGYKLSDIIFNGSEEELKLTKNTQPALVTVSAAIWALIAPKIHASYFAGHSLGEYSALYAAGAISFEDTIRAVHKRGSFMQEAVPVGVGAMAAVLGISDDVVEEECKAFSKDDRVVEPANFNCNGQIVIAGHKAALEEFSEVLKAKGAKRVVMLPVSAPFHCSLMKKAQENMSQYLKSVDIKPLKTPVINNIDAKIELEPDQVRSALIRQISGSVRWSQSVRNMVADGVDTFIEVGAGSVLSGLIKKIDPDVKTISISTVDDLNKL